MKGLRRVLTVVHGVDGVLLGVVDDLVALSLSLRLNFQPELIWDPPLCSKGGKASRLEIKRFVLLRNQYRFSRFFRSSSSVVLNAVSDRFSIWR